MAHYTLFPPPNSRLRCLLVNQGELRQTEDDALSYYLDHTAEIERAIARALQSFGPSGASLIEIASTAGLRHQDVRTNLKAMIQQGQVLREEQTADIGAGREESTARHNLIPVPAYTMIPDFYSLSALFYRPIISVRGAKTGHIRNLNSPTLMRHFMRWFEQFWSGGK